MGALSSREQGQTPELTSVNRHKSDIVSQIESERVPLIGSSAASKAAAQLDSAHTRRLLELLRAKRYDDATEQAQEIETLVREGASVDAGAWPDTALCIAIRKGWPNDVVDILLNHSANRTSSVRFLGLLCQLERNRTIRQQKESVQIEWDDLREELEGILRKGEKGLEELSLMDDFSLRDLLECLNQAESSNERQQLQAAILDSGYGFRRFSDIPLDQLKALLDPSVLLSSSCPWRLCLELSRECDNRAVAEKSDNGDWLKVSDELETLAKKTLELHEYVMEVNKRNIPPGSKQRKRVRNVAVVSMVDCQKKKFASCPAVEGMLTYRWYNSEEPSTLCKVRNLVTGLGKLILQFLISLLDVVLLPLLLLIGLICLLPCGKIEWLRKGVRVFLNKVAGKGFFIPRFVLFTWYSLSYFGFFALIIALSVLGVSPSSIEVLEWVMLVYWLSLILEEYRIFGHTPWRIYRTGWFYVCNYTVVLLFHVYFVLRFVGVYADSLQCSRAASHIFGFAGFVVCLSLVNYVQMFLVQSVGLVNKSIGRVLPKMLNFLALFAMCLVAFGVWMTGIQRGSVYLSHDHQTAGEILPNNTNANPSINFESSFLLLFWALFGQTSYDAFDVDTEVESILSTAIFALWLFIASLVLLNMLIGLATDEYTSTKEDAANEWNFLFARTIRIVVMAGGLMVYPLPFNISCRFNDFLVTTLGRTAGMPDVEVSAKNRDRILTAAQRGIHHKELYPRLLELRDILLFVYRFRQNGRDQLVNRRSANVRELACELNDVSFFLVEDFKRVWRDAVTSGAGNSWQLEEMKASSILRARCLTLSGEAVNSDGKVTGPSSHRAVEDLVRRFERLEASHTAKFQQLSEELSTLTKLVLRLVDQAR